MLLEISETTQSNRLVLLLQSGSYASEEPVLSPNAIVLLILLNGRAPVN